MFVSSDSLMCGHPLAQTAKALLAPGRIHNKTPPKGGVLLWGELILLSLLILVGHYALLCFSTSSLALGRCPLPSYMAN